MLAVLFWALLTAIVLSKTHCPSRIFGVLVNCDSNTIVCCASYQGYEQIVVGMCGWCYHCGSPNRGIRMFILP